MTLLVIHMLFFHGYQATVLEQYETTVTTTQFKLQPKLMCRNAKTLLLHLVCSI